MTKKKEKEEDIIEQKDAEREAQEEIAEVEHAKGDFEVREKLKEMEARAEEYLNNWKRAVADFENYKKRQTQSAQEFAKYANLDLIMQILPVLDNFQAATAHIPTDQKDGAWVAGIMHIQKQLEKVLEDNGVAEIEVRVGDKFDPAIHEAVQSENKKEELKNKIAKVVLKGYKIGEKVIRAVRVVVE